MAKKADKNLIIGLDVGTFLVEERANSELEKLAGATLALSAPAASANASASTISAPPTKAGCPPIWLARADVLA